MRSATSIFSGDGMHGIQFWGSDGDFNELSVMYCIPTLWPDSKLFLHRTSSWAMTIPSKLDHSLAAVNPQASCSQPDLWATHTAAMIRNQRPPFVMMEGWMGGHPSGIGQHQRPSRDQRTAATLLWLETLLQPSLIRSGLSKAVGQNPIANPWWICHMYNVEEYLVHAYQLTGSLRLCAREMQAYIMHKALIDSVILCF